MKTFDYAAAWREVAKPAYDSLPQPVRDLLSQVTRDAKELHQLPDLSMPWPHLSDLREKFESLPWEVLAFAAHVIYFAGHWLPGGETLDDANGGHGETWKFSHYADQVLRARFIAGTSADAMRANGPFQIHQGGMRLCYSSRDMWTWSEVAPATLAGLTLAKTLHAEMMNAIPLSPAGRRLNRDREDRDSAVYHWFESLKTRALPWPYEWLPFVHISDRYMREEQDIRQARKPTGKDRAEILATAQQECAAFVEANRALLDAATLEQDRDDSHHGHDFWLTRNGHGCGFWDRGYTPAVSDALTRAAHAEGNADWYLGDDGFIYQM